jgi:hypothetical protein
MSLSVRGIFVLGVRAVDDVSQNLYMYYMPCM